MNQETAINLQAADTAQWAVLTYLFHQAAERAESADRFLKDAHVVIERMIQGVKMPDEDPVVAALIRDRASGKAAQFLSLFAPRPPDHR